MRNTIIIAVISLMIIGCTKDKFTTKPQLKFKKVNKDVFATGDELIITLSFTDKEGDLPGKFFIQRVTPSCLADTIFKDSTILPDFPVSPSLEGDIIVNYSVGTNNGHAGIMTLAPGECNSSDTCFFKFVLADKAGNKSDTAVSSIIVIN